MEIPSEYLLCMFTKEGAVSELLSSKKKKELFFGPTVIPLVFPFIQQIYLS